MWPYAQCQNDNPQSDGRLKPLHRYQANLMEHRKTEAAENVPIECHITVPHEGWAQTVALANFVDITFVVTHDFEGQQRYR